MSTKTRLRHSIIGRCARTAIRLAFRLRNLSDRPVKYNVANDLEISLYPQGEIAEFLSVNRLFEKTELALVASYLRPGMKVLDVGANIGLYSILADKRMQTGAVWAFEPSKETFKRLQRNLKLNSCKLVQSLQVALSDTPDSSSVLMTDSGFGDAYRYLKPTFTAPEVGQSELVRVTSLDRWAEENRVTDLNFLKVDIEGGEYRMLLGAEQTLRSNHDLTVFFESDAEWTTRAGVKQTDSFDILERCGYGLFAWDTRVNGWTSKEKKLLNSEMIWATRTTAALPQL